MDIPQCIFPVAHCAYYTEAMRFTTYGTAPEVVLFLLLCSSFDLSLAVFTFIFHCPFFLLFLCLHIILLSMLHHALSVCHAISTDRITHVSICQALLSQFFKSKYVTGAARLTTAVTQRLQRLASQGLSLEYYIHYSSDDHRQTTDPQTKNEKRRIPTFAAESSWPSCRHPQW